MPAESEKQRRFMGSELGRLREGKKTRTGMSEEQLEDFAEKPVRKDFFDHMEKTYGFKIEKGGPGSGRKSGAESGDKFDYNREQQRKRSQANFERWAKKIDRREGVVRPVGYKYTPRFGGNKGGAIYKTKKMVRKNILEVKNG